MQLLPNTSIPKGYRVAKVNIYKESKYVNLVGVETILGVGLEGHNVILYVLQNPENEFITTIHYRMLYDEEACPDTLNNAQFYATGQLSNTRQIHVFAKIV